MTFGLPNHGKTWKKAFEETTYGEYIAYIMLYCL